MSQVAAVPRWSGRLPRRCAMSDESGTETVKIGTETVKIGTADERSVGGRLVTSDGRTLPLRGIMLRADARGGLARVMLEQRFVNPYAEALRVSYLVPLPVDGAVAGYACYVGGRRIEGEIDRVRAA